MTSNRDLYITVIPNPGASNSNLKRRNSREVQRRDYNQNSVELEDLSSTSSSNSFTSRSSSVCPHCDRNIPQEDLPGHLKNHVMNGTVNYARLKELMLMKKDRQGEPSPSSSLVIQQEQESSSNDEGSGSLQPTKFERASDSQYHCGKCSSVFTNASEFELHERNHEDESIYKCPYCNKTFNKADVFERHCKIHTGEAPHPCHLCPKTFNQRVHLRSHLRKHNGEKPYGCHFCPRKYADRSSLTYHLNTHTNTRCLLFN